MAGERDLDRILAGFSVSRRPGTYVYVEASWDTFDPADVEAVVREAEGITFVVAREVAEAAGVDEGGFAAAWLTVDVETALEGVGLTAAMSRVLAEAGIPCNVLAGFHHDHLLVPADAADAALSALGSLASGR